LGQRAFGTGGPKRGAGRPPDRNLTHLHESLAPIASLIHAMPVEEDLATAAENYAPSLQQNAGSPPMLDLVHPGLGPYGHTASLVPGDPGIDIAERDVAMTGIC
jgi:6-phosphogluconolactonase